MAKKDNDLVSRLAEGNAVDVGQLKRLEQEVAALGRAGFMTDTGYAIRQPLGHPQDPQSPRRILANAVKTRQERQADSK